MNTDIDGSPIVILSIEEATAIYQILHDIGWKMLDEVERKIATKISKDLNLKELNNENQCP